MAYVEPHRLKLLLCTGPRFGPYHESAKLGPALNQGGLSLAGGLFWEERYSWRVMGSALGGALVWRVSGS